MDKTIATAIVPLSIANAMSPSQPVNLYNSDVSHHMSPHCQDFVSFTEMKMTLNATNQQSFHAEGVGEMVIPVLNGNTMDTCIHLQDVLYTPEVSYNLISIGRIDDAGYKTTFSDKAERRSLICTG